MAVYTEVDDDALSAFLARYDVGQLLSFKGIAEGVENSNYLLRTSLGSFILTLYEKRVDPADLPFFMQLMRHMERKGVPCAAPVIAKDGSTLGVLCGKPAALITFLEGVSVRRPTASHCGQLGQALADFHVAGQDFAGSRANTLSVKGWQQLLETVPKQANEDFWFSTDSLQAHLLVIRSRWPSHLPRGVIHADLFPDNVFFINNALSGLIDFYFACTDMLAYDLAICLNAWCFEVDGAFNITKGQALLEGYHAHRPLSDDELQAFPVLCQGAAMRFLLTRLVDWYNVPSGALVRRKDPLEYDRKLRFHTSAGSAAEYGWRFSQAERAQGQLHG